jgi:hypothetical protein
LQGMNAVEEHRESMPNTQRLCLLACFRGVFPCSLFLAHSPRKHGTQLLTLPKSRTLI